MRSQNWRARWLIAFAGAAAFLFGSFVVATGCTLSGAAASGQGIVAVRSAISSMLVRISASGGPSFASHQQWGNRLPLADGPLFGYDLCGGIHRVLSFLREGNR